MSKSPQGEVAALRKPSNNDDQLDAMTHQPDAIVAATESAVETPPEDTGLALLLHGPQLDGKGISQNDIDKMFD